MNRIKSEESVSYLASKEDNKSNENDIIKRALEILDSRIRKGNFIKSPTETRKYLRLHFEGLNHEVFTVMYLSQSHQIIDIVDEFRGTIDGASVYPREIAREALKHGAAAVIFAHNHPSGKAEPSRADEAITKRLKEALSLLDIRVLDHFVVGDEVVSFAERGLM